MRRALPLLLLPLAGCAGADRSYPSLLPRAIEGRGFAEPAAAPPAPVAADPALDAKIAARTSALATSDAAFTKSVARAATLTAAARSDKAGGERWLSAQTALADLDAQRAATSDAANALEQLAADRAAALQPDYPALDQARAHAQAQLTAEAQRIAELQATLPQG